MGWAVGRVPNAAAQALDTQHRQASAGLHTDDGAWVVWWRNGTEASCRCPSVQARLGGGCQGAFTATCLRLLRHLLMYAGRGTGRHHCYVIGYHCHGSCPKNLACGMSGAISDRVEGIALPSHPPLPAGPCTEGVAAEHGQERHDVVSDVDGAVDACERQL